jgi:hypothetical protein
VNTRLALILFALILASIGCAASAMDDDFRQIELLVARRPDILKPLWRIERLDDGQMEVMSGQWDKVGAKIDIFRVARHSGHWVISSTIERNVVGSTRWRQPKDLTNRSSQPVTGE